MVVGGCGYLLRIVENPFRLQGVDTLFLEVDKTNLDG